MNKDIKTQWVAALRSGEYAQTTHILKDASKDTPEFCCLGVLCDLHSKATGTPWRGNFYLNHNAQLPFEVAQWAEFDDKELDGYADVKKSPVIMVDGVSLTDLNDFGKNFKYIADFIEHEGKVEITHE